MGTKQTDQVGDNKATTTNKQDANSQTPKSALTNGELDGTTVREPSVGVTEKLSFDERTVKTQPFMAEDGSQVNGAEDDDDKDNDKDEPVRNPVK